MINTVFLVTLAIITLGYLLKRFGIVEEKDGKIISKFLMHTTVPALMISVSARMQFEEKFLALSFLAVVLGSVLLSLSWFIFRKYPNYKRALLIMGSGGFNTGMFAFPIIEDIWGKEGLQYAVMFDIGNTMIVFGAIYMIGQYFSPNNEENELNFSKSLQKILKSAPVFGLIVGFLINFSHIELPSVANEFLDTLARANKAIVLVLMGIYLNFKFEKSQLFDVGKVFLVRYSVGLLLVLLISIFAPSSIVKNVAIVYVILPVGLTLLPFSDELGYDSRIAGLLVNLSLLISFGLIWAVVLFG